MLRLKELRLCRKLTQTQLAEQIHLTQNTVSDWETERTHPDIDALKNLASFFDVSIDYLVGYEDEFGNKIKN